MNFWYILANDSDCLKTLFLDYFEESHEYHNQIHKNCCCSNYNVSLKLEKADKNDKYYLYHEHDNKFNAEWKKILEKLTT